MLHTLHVLEMSSHELYVSVYHAGLLLVVLAVCLFILARVREFVHIRYVLTKEITELSSMNTLTKSVVMITRTTFTVTDIIDKMATTRSRWYVLRLAVKSIRRASVINLLLDVMQTSRPVTSSGRGVISDLFSSAF